MSRWCVTTTAASPSLLEWQVREYWVTVTLWTEFHWESWLSKNYRDSFVQIGDCAYTPTEHLVPMFCGEHALLPKNNNFNLFASQLQKRIKMAFGMMVNKRWAILFRPLSTKLKENYSSFVLSNPLQGITRRSQSTRTRNLHTNECCISSSWGHVEGGVGIWANSMKWKRDTKIDCPTTVTKWWGKLKLPYWLDRGRPVHVNCN
jgi:hypothetical protein